MSSLDTIIGFTRHVGFLASASRKLLKWRSEAAQGPADN